MLNAIVAIVNFSARRPWLVLALSLAVTAACGRYVATNFQINTDISKLISSSLPWRAREIAYGAAFPKQDSAILAVIDAKTPELAEEAAARLVQALKGTSPYVRGARELTGGPFFQKNGFLYLSDDELATTLKDLGESAPLLIPIAADPSLRGVMEALSFSLKGIRFNRVKINDLSFQFDALAQAFENAAKGLPNQFSWRSLLSGGDIKPSQLRQLVDIEAVLNYDALEPGADATAAIRDAAKRLNFEADGTTLRLTGSVRISDEEFGTLKEDAGLNGVLTVGAVLVILWLALHSARIILAVFASLIVGLAATAALGLLWVGAFNPISIAFFVLFVGIGVDFGLQFSVSYRAERYEKPDLFKALVATASGTGSRLALAALATAAGFLAFTPTAYRGLSELGEIAGAGMIIAFISSITVLPALLRLLNPPAEPHPLGYAFLEPVDRYLERKRNIVLIGTVAAVVLGSPLLYWLRFDINPMNLRSPKVESVSTYYDLRKDPETRGGTAEVLTRSLDDANALAERMRTLPEVDKTRVMTLSSFIPDHQDQKLDSIAQTAARLQLLLHPPGLYPSHTDAEIIASLEDIAAQLKDVSQGHEGEGGQSARRLSAALTQLAKGKVASREAAEAALMAPFKVILNNVRQSLAPEKISLATLPKDLTEEWKASDGRFRVSIAPKEDTSETPALRRFVDAVTQAEPSVTGEPVGILRAGEAIVDAFEQAALWALISIAVLLYIALRRVTDVALTLIPLLLAAVVTLELCSLLGLKLNFANIIALPLLLGVGVAFKIYYVMAWREGRSGLLSSPLTRAVFFSGMTTAVAFGSLWLSNHPGTSSMGQLLALALVSTMAAAVLFQPLLMGPPRAVQPSDSPSAKRSNPTLGRTSKSQSAAARPSQAKKSASTPRRRKQARRGRSRRS